MKVLVNNRDCDYTLRAAGKWKWNKSLPPCQNGKKAQEFFTKGRNLCGMHQRCTSFFSTWGVCGNLAKACTQRTHPLEQGQTESWGQAKHSLEKNQNTTVSVISGLVRGSLVLHRQRFGNRWDILTVGHPGSHYGSWTSRKR